MPVTLRQIQNTLEDKESHNETKKQLEGCPLRVEQLNQPGHLLIEVIDLIGMLHASVLQSHDSSLFRHLLYPDVVRGLRSLS